MRNKFFSAIEEYNMISPGNKIAVGVSGGADSMCLLHLLTAYSEELEISVVALHLNHCLRGEESDRDEKYVVDYCRENSIEYVVKRADINALSAETGESTELCARKVRYDFFSSVNADRIATAHTGSDSIETFLMNLSRGSTLKGLCGIPPVRDDIIRPLIFFTREDTERYCKENSICYVTDSSNLSDDYTRNKYRHSVLPELVKINPAFCSNALRCIEYLKDDENYLEEVVLQAYFNCLSSGEHSLSVEKTSALSKALKNRVICHFIEQESCSDYSSKHIELIAGILIGGGAVQLPQGDIFFSDGKILLKRMPAEEKADDICLTLYKNRPQTVYFFDYRISFDISDKPSRMKNEYTVDFFKIDDIIKIHSRQAGSSITLRERRCTKTLKKLFNEIGIPQEKRCKIPVLCDSRGVICAGDIAVDSSRLPSADSEKYLIIKMERDKND